jgi:hypothetical protein
MTLTPYQRSRQNTYHVRKFRSRHSDFFDRSRPAGVRVPYQAAYWHQQRRWTALRTHAALTQYSLEHTT